VLDNFEHLLEGADLVNDILKRASNLVILVTSRERLNLQAEWLFDVDGLAYPLENMHGSLGLQPPSLTDYSAVQLFVQRASQAQLEFPLTESTLAAMARICQHLAGMPLAIELAAASVRMLPLREIERQIRTNLGMLATTLRDVPPRHRSMRAVFDHSWKSLSEGECALFSRLAVFRGGWSLAAAEQVAGATLPTLTLLVDKSLVRAGWAEGGAFGARAERNSAAEPRYTMLEPIREYALERLAAAGELAEVRRRHAEHYLALAEAAEPELRGPRQKSWLDRLEADHDNLRAALAWSLEDKQTRSLELSVCLSRVEIGLRIAGALWRFWWMRGNQIEGLNWVPRALAQPGAPSSPSRAKALLVAGELTRSLCDYAAARPLYEESLAIGRAIDDKHAIFAALIGLIDLEQFQQHDIDQGMVLVEQSLALARELGDIHAIADALSCLGRFALFLNDYARAGAALAQAVALRRGAGDIAGLAWTLQRLAWVAQRQGDYALATRYFTECLAVYQELDDRTAIAGALGALGWTARYQGDLARAQALIEESLAIQRRMGNRDGIAYELHDLGYVFFDQGDLARAAACFVESLELFHEHGSVPGVLYCLKGLADAAAKAGQAEWAARLFGAHAALSEEVKFVFPPIDQAVYDCTVADVRASLGQPAFAAAWAAGRALPLAQAVAEANAGPHPPPPSMSFSSTGSETSGS
jgi:predicted ATPase